MKIKRYKSPIEYSFSHSKFKKGKNKLELSLKNLAECELSELRVGLHSLDTYSIGVLKEEDNLKTIKEGKEKKLTFDLLVNLPGFLYITIDGKLNSDFFHWESPYIKMRLDEVGAEFVSLFYLSGCYPPKGKVLRMETVIRGLGKLKSADVEFWLEEPDKEFKEIDVYSLKNLKKGEIRRRATEFIPQKEGLYTIYGYLYEGNKRTAVIREKIWVEKSREK